MKILFLCTGNACRSQMAEGWAKHLWADRFEIYSAGVESFSLDPRAVKIMAEKGVDISGQRSKHVSELRKISFDLVITLCSHAHKTCPIFPGSTKVVHHGFPDPPRLAAKSKTEEEAMAHYNRVCAEIKELVETLPQVLKEEGIKDSSG